MVIQGDASIGELNARCRVILVAMLIVAAILACSCGAEAPRAEPSPLGIADLNTRKVIGALGLPLGTTAEIEATVIDGRDLGDKGSSGAYLLRIEAVNGAPSPDKPIMHFVVHGWVETDLVTDHFSRYERLNGKVAHLLTGQDIDEINRGYVAKTFRLAVYEAGGYAGIPSGLPRDVEVWQDYGFSFSSHVVVLKQR